MKLLGSTKSNIVKDKSDENVPHLKITEVVLGYCNIANNSCQQNLRVLCTFIPINHLVSSKISHLQTLYF